MYPFYSSFIDPKLGAHRNAFFDAVVEQKSLTNRSGRAHPLVPHGQLCTKKPDEAQQKMTEQKAITVCRLTRILTIEYSLERDERMTASGKKSSGRLAGDELRDESRRGTGRRKRSLRVRVIGQISLSATGRSDDGARPFVRPTGCPPTVGSGEKTTKKAHRSRSVTAPWPQSAYTLLEKQTKRR
jgi:hypothetical protein